MQYHAARLHSIRADYPEWEDITWKAADDAHHAGRSVFGKAWQNATRDTVGRAYLDGLVSRRPRAVVR